MINLDRELMYVLYFYLIKLLSAVGVNGLKTLKLSDQ